DLLAECNRFRGFALLFERLDIGQPGRLRDVGRAQVLILRRAGVLRQRLQVRHRFVGRQLMAARPQQDDQSPGLPGLAHNLLPTSLLGAKGCEATRQREASGGFSISRGEAYSGRSEKRKVSLRSPSKGAESVRRGKP